MGTMKEDRIGWIPAIGTGKRLGRDGGLGYVVDLLEPYMTDADALEEMGGERIWQCKNPIQSHYTTCGSDAEESAKRIYGYPARHDECGWVWLIPEN